MSKISNQDKMFNPFGHSTEDENTGFMFFQLSNLWKQQQEHFIRKYFNINQTQYAILASTYWLTYKGNEVTQSELARQSKLEKMTLSKNLKHLKTLGYVDIIPHSLDTRANSVSVTESGVAFLKKSVPMVENMDARFFHLPIKSIKVLNDMLLKLIDTNDFSYLR